MADLLPIQKASVQNQTLHDSAAMALHKLLHQLVEYGSFMILARRQAQPAVQEELSLAIGVQQSHQLVTASPTVLLLWLASQLLGIDRMIVLIKQQP